MNIYNIEGKRVLAETKRAQRGGKKQIKINSNNLKSGIYIVELENNKRREIKKFTILK